MTTMNWTSAEAYRLPAKDHVANALLRASANPRRGAVMTPCLYNSDNGVVVYIDNIMPAIEDDFAACVDRTVIGALAQTAGSVSWEDDNGNRLVCDGNCIELTLKQQQGHTYAVFTLDRNGADALGASLQRAADGDYAHHNQKITGWVI